MSANLPTIIEPVEQWGSTEGFRDLIPIQNVKKEARHARKRLRGEKGCCPAWKMPPIRLTLGYRLQV